MSYNRKQSVPQLEMAVLKNKTIASKLILGKLPTLNCHALLFVVLQKSLPDLNFNDFACLTIKLK